MEKPILFSSEMVRAILDGRKTQTRRVIRDLPSDFPDGIRCDVCIKEVGDFWCLPTSRGYKKSPYGKPGDLLWVRETWLELEKSHWCDTRKPKSWFDDCYGRVNAIAYRAGITQDGEDARQEYGYKWRPSIFMPRWASRLTLRVVDVRVERVQDISEADAMAEGVERGGSTPRHAFIALWDSINAKRNPQLIEPEWTLWTWGKDETDDLESIGLDIANPDDIVWRDQNDADTQDWRRFGDTPPISGGRYEVIWENGDAPQEVYLHRSQPSPSNIIYPYSWDSNPWVWVVEFEVVK